MILVDGLGVEILDRSAGALVPEARLLAPERILLRIYSNDLSPEQVPAVLEPFKTAHLAGVASIGDDWKEQWKAFFRRTRIGDRIVVRPPWEKPSKNSDDLNVIIEPGMAFGTGLHETTKLCALALEKTIRPSQSILDVGCGSGILSIIAAKMGATEVCAIDIDPDSVTATTDNSVRNHVASQISVSTTPLSRITQRFELVIANILSHILIELADDLARVVQNGGRLVLSGILSEQSDHVIMTFENLGLDLLEQLQDGEWVAQVWRRNA